MKPDEVRVAQSGTTEKSTEQPKNPKNQDHKEFLPHSSNSPNPNTAHLDKNVTHDVSAKAAEEVNKTTKHFADYKAVQFAWDLATKEIPPG